MDFKDKLIKEYEQTPAAKLLKAPLYALQGVSEGDAVKMKKAFGLDSIAEMAAFKYYHRACAIKKEAVK